MEAYETDGLAAGRTWASRLVEVLQPVRMRADRLRSMAVFSTLSPADLEFAARILRETLVEPRARMTVQGQPGPRLWLVLEGEALVSADARPVRVVGHGDFIGLAGLLNGVASPETTIALAPIRAFEADVDGFAELFARPSIRRRLVAAEAALSEWPRRPLSTRRRSSPVG